VTEESSEQKDESAESENKAAEIKESPVVDRSTESFDRSESSEEPIVNDQDDSKKKRVREKSEKTERAPRDEEKSGRTLRSKKDRNTKTLSPEQEIFRDMLLDMSSTHNAKILSTDNSVIKEVAVKGLVNSLKEESEGISTIIFDGVISQRILDVSAEKGIGTIVGTRKGNITKMPANIVIWTKEDLY